MKVKVSITTTNTGTVDIGQIPLSLFRDVILPRLAAMDNDANWAFGDLRPVDEDWTVTDIEAVGVTKK